MECQIWKINFRTEVCLRTADPQVTALWHKESEIAKSIDELVTSRSITGQHNFLIFDVLDAMIASALKKLLNTQSHFRKRASVEEQRAQSSDRFLRGRQIAHMIYEYFCASGAYEAVQGLSTLFTMSFAEWRRPRFRCKMGSCTINSERNASRRDPGRIYTSQNYRILLFNFRLMVLHDQEVARNNGTPNDQKFKTAVGFHRDQMKRNGNFRVRRDVVEWGSVTKSQKGNNAKVERKMEVISVEGTWTMFPKVTHVVSDMTHKTLETEDKVSVPETKRAIVFSRIPLTARDKNPHWYQAIKTGKLERYEWNSMPIHILWKSVMWILASSRVSVLQVWKKKKRLYTLRQNSLPTRWGRRNAQRSRRKVVQKDQLRYWRSLYTLVVYLKILIRESFLRERGKFRSKPTVKFSQMHLAPN